STVFPTKGKFGSTITWKSSNTAVISDTGTVTPGKTGVDVTLTKTAKFGSATQVATEVHYVKGSGGNNNNGGGGSGGGNVSGGGGIINIIDKPVPEEVEKSVFPDVSKDSWAYNYIKTLAEKNVVSGDQNGNFNPEKPILREEYLKLLITALDFKIDKSATSNFSDVPNDSWFAPYVNTALRIGLVNGISEDLFGAGDKVTREDMAVMAYRALELKDISLDKTENTELKDIEKVSEYAKDAVNALANAKIITGDTAGYFNPFDVALREQAAKIIYLLMQEK
ncbi:MAG: S-layer homology domain-containing protein, partial [Oscillospiraceae bacterium]